MGERICKESGCHEPAHCRLMCKRHYGISYRRGLPPKQLELPLTRHSLSGIDGDKREGLCSLCGPVGLRRRGNGSYECGPKHRSDKARAKVTKEVRRRDTLRKYDMTIESYNAMREGQGGLCAICGESVSGNLVVDHDHATGFVRALLCRTCNLALGYLRDNPAMARAAADYLDLHSATV